jgi:hypothetical protein
VKYKVRRSAKKDGHVVLKFSLSASISDERVTKVLGNDESLVSEHSLSFRNQMGIPLGFSVLVFQYKPIVFVGISLVSENLECIPT